MKKSLMVFGLLLAFTLILLTGCSSSSSRDKEKIEKLEADVKLLRETLASSIADYDKLKTEYEAVKKELDDYKLLSGKTEEAKQLQNGENPTYDDLARYPDETTGKYVTFYGKVVQVIEGKDEIQLRFAVDDNYDQMLLLAYKPGTASKRVLEDDYLTIQGLTLGTMTYQSTLGGNITIPAVYVDKIEFH